MTERADLPEPPDVDADVEVASALLDEEATADERARAEDTSVQAHLGELRAVAARVGEVPPVPDGLLDQHVAVALDAFDAPAAEARVVPLEARRAGRRTWWQRAPLGAVAAVVAVVALVGAVGLASMGGGDDDDTATAAFDEPGGGGDSADDSSEAFSVTEDGATLESSDGAAGSAPGARPAYADLDELADELAARHRLRRQSTDADADADADVGSPAPAPAPAPDDGAPRAGTTSEQAEPDPCDAVAVAGIDPAEVIEIAPALVGGTPVTAVVHGDPGSPRLAVVDDGSCEVLEARDLPDGD